MKKVKNRNEACSECGKKVKKCACVSKKGYKKTFFITFISLVLVVSFFYLFAKEGGKTDNEKQQNVLTKKESGKHYENPEEAYQSLINFISDRKNGTYMVLLLKDRSKLNFSIAINHGTHLDPANNRTANQLKKISWWFNQIKGDKLFLVEQAGNANEREYGFEEISAPTYYEKILMSNFLAGVENCKIRECDIRKNLFHEFDGKFYSMVDYAKIAEKANYNIINIVFDLEPEDLSTPIGQILPKIMSPDYNLGFKEGLITKEDLYESLLFEQSSVLFEEECVKYMDENRSVFSITGAMHAPYICENILFVASSPEELSSIIQVTNRHLIMRNLLNKNAYNDPTCVEYKKICSYLNALFGAKVPIHYKYAY